MNQTVRVLIQGTSPLLMHRFPLVPVEGIEKKEPREQAELAAYRHPDNGDLYVPAVNLQRALVSAAAYSKGKGRATLQRVAAACLLVAPERVSLNRKEFAVDSQAVVIAATKGRIVRHRPRLDEWALEFTIEYDDVLLKNEQVRRIVDDAGARVGLLDFRPEKKGPFGRFIVTRWSA